MPCRPPSFFVLPLVGCTFTPALMVPPSAPSITDAPNSGVEDGSTVPDSSAPHDTARDTAADRDGDGFTTTQGDCAPHDADIYPGAAEVCDGGDNNCDGLVDFDGASSACSAAYATMSFGGSAYLVPTNISGTPLSTDWFTAEAVCADRGYHLIWANYRVDPLEPLAIADVLLGEPSLPSNVMVWVGSEPCAPSPSPDHPYTFGYTDPSSDTCEPQSPLTLPLEVILAPNVAFRQRYALHPYGIQGLSLHSYDVVHAIEQKGLVICEREHPVAGSP